MIEFPKMMWISQYTVRFAFSEEISQESFLAVQQFNRFIRKVLHHKVVETVPGYFTVTVYLKGRQNFNEDELIEQWRLIQTERMNEYPSVGRELRVPVCYDEEFALDMERVMEFTDLSPEEIISLHISKTYVVHLVGFLPGFPYLGELDSRLHVPRLTKPRSLVNASSVGIGGYQTGIYPIDSPGGWNIIGKTPYPLFDVRKDEPTLFQVGDIVTFYEITKQEYYQFIQESV
ncbi:5-oxoprolinase subunit PxpB [Ureibacillus aquaedulcis]|uniref:5-oxoprolinase subunit PxpB n=1 Tax=Ureibacillus aquaedulcis TaxID=3058421 RepID=A0ABT8GW03_9BACL|nr:5-oxoprolinase subunit PxpB [Ureibacillus sp. BA0131]MDN4495593.1 5-oxoprolinase subunit PxpB [Ureibacillus sp. BA0131]